MSGRELGQARLTAIIIEFVGGSQDGGQLSSDARNEQEATLTRRLYYRSTRKGTVGQQFRIVSEASVDFQWIGGDEAIAQGRFHLLDYEVSERIEDRGNILVRCKFVDAVNEPA
jgi:hypothetical protein